VGGDESLPPLRRALKTVAWDEDTRKIVEKDRADEDEHIARWQGQLQKA